MINHIWQKEWTSEIGGLIDEVKDVALTERQRFALCFVRENIMGAKEVLAVIARHYGVPAHVYYPVIYMMIEMNSDLRSDPTPGRGQDEETGWGWSFHGDEADCGNDRDGRHIRIENVCGQNEVVSPYGLTLFRSRNPWRDFDKEIELLFGGKNGEMRWEDAQAMLDDLNGAGLLRKNEITPLGWTCLYRGSRAQL